MENAIEKVAKEFNITTEQVEEMIKNYTDKELERIKQEEMKRFNRIKLQTKLYLMKQQRIKKL